MDNLSVGTMVWVWLQKIEKWSGEKYELRAIGNEAYAYSDGSCIRATCEITTKNPHGKKCELLKDGEELLEYDEKSGKFGGVFLLKLQGSMFHCLQGFVVELGNGEHMKVSNPIRWTGKKGSSYDGDCYSYSVPRAYLSCKIIGAIMSGGGE